MPPNEPDVVDAIGQLTLDLQDYLRADPDLRATDLLAAAIEIIDALLAQWIDLDARLETAHDRPAVLIETRHALSLPSHNP